jgi:hypothetical protein
MNKLSLQNSVLESSAELAMDGLISGGDLILVSNTTAPFQFLKQSFDHKDIFCRNGVMTSKIIYFELDRLTTIVLL